MKGKGEGVDGEGSSKGERLKKLWLGYNKLIKGRKEGKDLHIEIFMRAEEIWDYKVRHRRWVAASKYM